ncbi:MAG: protein kinase [Planctomycetes bacterium]|nr:protein kinase [Planctomycetota bacterium]
MSAPADPEDDLPELPTAVEERLFEILFGHADDEQAALLDRLRAEHPACRDSLDRRLRSMTAGMGLLDRAGSQLREAPLPSRIGPYHIRDLLGEGGFGVVYRAEQLEPVRRVVALKVLHPRRLDERSLWRFQTERQTLARMGHRNISQIHDAGTTPDGLLFFAMEFVDGEPITRWCDRRRYGIDARLALFLEVCAAVQHAHQRGVVHRDLKPGNILVKAEGETAVPKVIDFGVAKIIDADEVDPLATREGAMIGTPAYMSPEQAAGGPVDTRTDVYALGVLLYELLAGDLPFAAERFDGVGIAEVARVVREEEPRRMSTAASAGAAGIDGVCVARGTRLAALLGALRGDLEWVVRRAMAKDPELRYASVAGLIADVERSRRREPVAAREPEALYLLRRFVTLHRLAVGVSAAIAVALAVVFVALVDLLDEVEAARQTAVERGDAAELNGYAAHLAAANAALESGDLPNAIRHLDDAPPRHRGWEWRYLASQCDTSLADISSRPGHMPKSVVWLDDERLILLYFDGSVEIRDADAGVLLEQPIALVGGFQEVCHDSRRRMLVAIVDTYRSVIAIDTRSWQQTLLFDAVPVGSGNDHHIRSVTMAPDDRTVAISANSGSVMLLDARGERPPLHLCRTRLHASAMAFTPDGEHLVLATMSGFLEVRRVEDGVLEREVFLDAEGVSAMTIDPGGLIAYATSGLSLYKVDLASGEVLIRTPTAIEITNLRRAADGTTIFGVGGWWTGRVTVWSAQTLELVGRHNGHRRGVLAVEQSPDGSRIATASFDGTRVWSRQPMRFARQLPAGNHANDLAVADDGAAFCAVSRDGTLRIWDARTCALLQEVVCGCRLFGCELTRDSAYVGGDRVFALDRATGDLREGQKPGYATARMCLDASGRFLASTRLNGGRACIWRVPELEVVHDLEVPVLDRVVFDERAGRFLFSASDGRLRAIDPETGDVAAEPGNAGWSALAVRGEALASGQQPLQYRLQADAPLRVLSAELEVTAVAFSPDMQRIVTGSPDSLVRFWNPQGTELLVLDDAPKMVAELAFALSGQRLVALSHIQGAECYVMVWGAELR